MSDLFLLEDSESKIKLKDADFETDTIHELRLELGDDFELLEKAKQVMDWVVLRSILKDEKSVNAQKLSLYNYVKSEVLYSKRDWLKNDWKENTHGIIRQTMQSNKVKYTEFAFENRGGLWGKPLGLVPRKGEVDGAGKPYELSTCFFALISYQTTSVFLHIKLSV